MPERYQDSDQLRDIEVATTLSAKILEMNLPPRVRAGLTSSTDKQRDFAVLYAHGINKVTAYVTAYRPKPTTTYGSLRARAYQVARNATVTEAVDLIEKHAGDRIKLGQEVLKKCREGDAHLSGRQDGQDPVGFEDGVTLAVEAKGEAAPAVTREWVVERLTAEAKNEKNSGSVRVRALELVGKAEGLFEDTLHVKDERPNTAGEAAQQLAGLLREVREGLARRNAVLGGQEARRLALGGMVDSDDDDPE